MDDASDPLDEEALRLGVLRGDADAWRALYRRAFAPVWAFVVVRTRPDLGAAEEVAQEAWMVAVRRIAHFDPLRAPFEAWVRGIAANVLRNRSRAGRRAPDVVGLEPAALGRLEAPPASADPGERATRALTTLPWTYQQVLRAKYEEGLPVVAIAQRLGRSAKSVESLLTRARVALRRALADGSA